MNVSFLFEMLFNVIRGFLFNTKKAAPYAKWCLRIRDYLLVLFPVDLYPVGGTGDSAYSAMSGTVTPVPVEAVKSAASAGGFKLPFLN